MALNLPQIDLPLGLSGGADVWDEGVAGIILSADYFADAAPPADITGSLAATETGADTFVATGKVVIRGAMVHAGLLNA